MTAVGRVFFLLCKGSVIPDWLGQRQAEEVFMTFRVTQTTLCEKL